MYVCMHAPCDFLLLACWSAREADSVQGRKNIHTLITLQYITLHYITLHYITLHYIALHCIALHYLTLHCIALHCIGLDYITYIHIHTLINHGKNPVVRLRIKKSAFFKSCNDSCSIEKYRAKDAHVVSPVRWKSMTASQRTPQNRHAVHPLGNITSLG